MDVNKMIGQNLRAARELRRYTRDQLVFLLGETGYRSISASTLQAWENGSRALPADAMVYLCSILGTSPCALLIAVIPSIGEEESMISSFQSLPQQERKILHFLFQRWKGDIHCLIHLCYLYAAMSCYYRVQFVRYAVRIYSRAARDHAVTLADIPLDLQTLDAGYRSLRHRSNLRPPK